MTVAKYHQWLLNIATGVVTILAIIVGVVRVRASFFDSATATHGGVKTSIVTNWHEFASAGTRMGPANARVTIVEFSDFQCPYCRVASGDLHDLRNWYTNDVAVVYRHLPIHAYAHQAALAAECAARMGAFERLHDQFFAQPESIGKKPWTGFAVEAGIRDTVRFRSCMNDPSVEALVRQDSAAAMTLGTDVTPTFLIDSLMVRGNPGFEQLNEYVRAILGNSR